MGNIICSYFNIQPLIIFSNIQQGCQDKNGSNFTHREPTDLLEGDELTNKCVAHINNFLFLVLFIY